MKTVLNFVIKLSDEGAGMRKCLLKGCMLQKVCCKFFELKIETLLKGIEF